ncbi:hypothetical protein J6590_101122 [Homalodisca vitripennis]|nr:hypothetical protein J6590_101122 [Homalodisca vitripennis]
MSGHYESTENELEEKLGSLLEIEQVRMSVTLALYQYHRLCNLSTFPLILFDKILAQATAWWPSAMRGLNIQTIDVRNAYYLSA